MTHRVIFVHGISDTIINYDYSANFVELLLHKLKLLDVIPNNASKDEISKIITFENVNYSEIGHTEEETALKDYDIDADRLYNFLDKTIDKVLFHSIRRYIITSVSDVLVYESDFWREKVRSTLRQKISPYVGTDDKVTIIGHSLGSVVSFDTLYYASKDDENWKKSDFKVRNLFTLGSPIALFSLELDNKMGETKSRYSSQKETIPDSNFKAVSWNFIQEGGVWYNFFDAQDLIGYPLETLFKDKFEVKDILVQTGTFPINAHIGYWKNTTVIDTVAARLKSDLQ